MQEKTFNKLADNFVSIFCPYDLKQEWADKNNNMFQEYTTKFQNLVTKEQGANIQ